MLTSGIKKELFSLETLILCIAAVLGNTIFSVLFYGAPLFLDTVFTVALCFCVGPLPAIFATFVLFPALVTFTHMYLFGTPVEMYGTVTFFGLCTLTETILVFLFHKKIKNQDVSFLETPSLPLFTNIAAWLFVLVVLDCIAISVTGGLIDMCLTLYFSTAAVSYPEEIFKLAFLRGNMSYLAAAILSRIPVNIVDRTIAILCGYGLSLLYKKFRRKKCGVAVL